MNFHVWNIGRAKFKGFPGPEDTLIIGLGHIERKYSAQAFTIFKILAGKQLEGWQFVQPAFLDIRQQSDFLG